MTDEDELNIDEFGLYEETGEDWNVHVTISLTEPVCTCISIRPEGYNISRYTVWVDSDKDLATEIAKLCAAVKSEVVDKVLGKGFAPYSNPDDAPFEKWLSERGGFPEHVK